MKQIVWLVGVLVVFANVNTFSATRKSNSQKDNILNKLSEPERIATEFLNEYVKKDKQYTSAEDSEEKLANWIYENKILTDSFKTEYSKYLMGFKMWLCMEYDDDCYLNPDSLSYEEEQFLQNYGGHPIRQGNGGFPEKFLLVTYNPETGIATFRGKNWLDYKVFVKVIQQDRNWMIDGAGQVNIPKELYDY